jgi:lipopolysaccharide exporter
MLRLSPPLLFVRGSRAEMNDERQENLADSTITALRWSYGGGVAQAVSQLLIGIILARILGPSPFGILAAAWLVIGLANQWADVGLSAALVQRSTICERDIRYAFTVQLIVAIWLTAIVATSATFAAQILRRPELTWVIRALSFTFVIQVFGLIATSLLRRDLDFKTVQTAKVLSYVIGYLGMGVPLAVLGFGVWSLAVAQLGQSLLNSVFLYTRVRHPIKPFLGERSRGLLGFGSKVTAINLVNWVVGYMDSAFLARYFGVLELGLYNRACALTTASTTSILSSLQGVLFPAYSKRQQDLCLLRRVYLTSVASVALVIFPVFTGVAVAHRSVIEGLYGDRWSAAGPLLVPFALAMVFHSLMSLAGPLLWARARAELELWVQAVVAVLFVMVLLVTSRVSVLAVAWGVFLIYFVRFLLMTSQLLRIIEASWMSVLGAVRGASLMALWSSIFIWLADRLMLSFNVPPLLRLGSNLIFGAVAVVGFVLLFPGTVFGSELAWLVRRFSDRLPAAIQPLLRYISSVEGVIPQGRT